MRLMPGESTSAHEAATAFHDLHAFLGLRRAAGLAISPDGTRLVTTVQERSDDGKRFVSSLWEIDPTGTREPVRLTRSDKGETAPAFLPDGTLLFRSSRELPASEHAKDDKDGALWALLPHGEPYPLLRRADFGAYTTTRDSARLAFTAAVLPSSADAADDVKRRKNRDDAAVSAILYTDGPLRYWDHDLGPGVPHVFTSDVAAPAADRPSLESASEDSDTAEGRGPAARAGDTAVDCGVQGDTEGVTLSWDGTLVAYTVVVPGQPFDRREAVVIADAATGRVLRTIDYGPGQFAYGPSFTPDGAGLVIARGTDGTYEEIDRETLWYLPLADDAPEPEGWDLLPDSELGAHDIIIAPRPDAEGRWTLYFVADEQGRAPLFRVTFDPRDPANVSAPARLTSSGAYASPVLSPDGDVLYAMRAAIDAPFAPVRLDPSATDAEATPLPNPAPVGPIPGTLTEVTARGEDGTPIRAWLALPVGASAANPAPLLVNVHGGPQSSHNTWNWRWTAWPFTARGYAVLMPDPALSTGYGEAFIQRGWKEWGGAPYTDILALTDAALAREDLDAERTALAGGSYGGYMANWVAGHTNRFRCIVTHASLWNITSFAGTTDAPQYWIRCFGDPLTQPARYEQWSPHRYAENISTPMLVVHGALDYRVPYGEGHALWFDLRRLGVPSRFLYFPDENHWVLKPQNSKRWHEEVFAWIDRFAKKR